MPFAHKVVRVTIGGTAWSGAEIWNTGFYMGKVDADASDPTFDWAEAVRTQWTTFFGSTGATGAFSNQYVTQYIKLSLINPDGKADKPKTVFANIQTPIAGGVGINMPPQCALVGTLTSSFARGFAAKGRMYLPPPAAAIENSGKINVVHRDAIRTRFATMFTNLNGDANVPDDVILASSGIEGDPDAEPPKLPLPGRNALVTGVRVGDVIDTQRRRRNQLVESYATGTVTN